MTLNPTIAVNPSAQSLAELATSNAESPIAMLNLLRFDGEAGRAVYGRYAHVAAETIAAVGGSLMYVGQVIEPDDWDTVALVFYPNVQAFLAMQLDARYREAISDRTAGLQARLLYPFELPNIDGAAAAELVRCDSSTTLVTRLVSVATVTGSTDAQRAPTDGAEVSQLRAIGGGLVADSPWDELHLLRRASSDGCLESELPSPDPSARRIFVVRSQPAAPA